MFTIKLLDKKTNKSFEKKFDSFYLFNKFLAKVKYSKKLVILSTTKFWGDEKNENRQKRIFTKFYW